MRRLRALDLFCGAGGASRGLADAGFEVWGVDIVKQPRYPYNFVHGHALGAVPESVMRRFDFIWASPPCQKHTAMRTMPDAREHQCWIEPTRALLQRLGVPYAIENVVGAPLIDPVMLCGTGLGLQVVTPVDGWELQRHRLIEASFPVRGAPCNHRHPVLGVYGGHVRDRRRREGSKARGRPDPPRELAERLMGIDWMTLDELSEAIPPAYSHHVAREFLRSMGVDAGPERA